MLSKRQQKKIKDGLRNPNQRILRRVNTFASVDLEEKIGQEDEP